VSEVGGEVFRVAIIGSGPAGMSAASHAAQLKLNHVLLEKTDHLSDTIYKYQKGKHVMATPSQLVLRSDQEFDAGKREDILGRWNKRTEELGVNVKYNAEVKSIRGTGPAIEGSIQKIVTRARDGASTTTEVQRHASPYAITLTSGEVIMAETVVLAIGTQGNPNLMRCPGGDLPHVTYQLDDPYAVLDEHIVVVGTGDAGIENARGLAEDSRPCIGPRVVGQRASGGIHPMDKPASEGDWAGVQARHLEITAISLRV
jgi:thioredoxin reductase